MSDINDPAVVESSVSSDLGKEIMDNISRRFGQDFNLIHEVLVTLGRVDGNSKLFWSSLASDVDLCKRVKNVVLRRGTTYYCNEPSLNTDFEDEVILHMRHNDIAWGANAVLCEPISSELFEKMSLDTIQQMRVANVNLMEWLLHNYEMIPTEWKSRNVFFLGTLFKSVRAKTTDNITAKYLHYDKCFKTWFFGKCPIKDPSLRSCHFILLR